MQPRITAKEKILLNYTEEQVKQVSQAQIAKSLELNQPDVSRALKSLGWKSCGQNFVRESAETKHLLYDQVLEYIKSNGGTVSKAIRELGYKLDSHAVHEYARKIGFNTAMYRNAYEKYGKWMIMPGEAKQKYINDYEVKAICCGCQTVHSVLLSNVRTGQSNGCKQCASEAMKKYQVRCLNTDQVFKSLRKFAAELNMLKSYQQLRIKLIRDKQIDIDGKTYVIEERLSSN